jgi:hypothetical protein
VLRLSAAVVASHGAARVTYELHVAYSRASVLEKLLQVKQASGRLKDLEAIAMLETSLQERREIGRTNPAPIPLHRSVEIPISPRPRGDSPPWQ